MPCFKYKIFKLKLFVTINFLIQLIYFEAEKTCQRFEAVSLIVEFTKSLKLPIVWT